MCVLPANPTGNCRPLELVKEAFRDHLEIESYPGPLPEDRRFTPAEIKVCLLSFKVIKEAHWECVLMMGKVVEE